MTDTDKFLAERLELSLPLIAIDLSAPGGRPDTVDGQMTVKGICLELQRNLLSINPFIAMYFKNGKVCGVSYSATLAEAICQAARQTLEGEKV